MAKVLQKRSQTAFITTDAAEGTRISAEVYPRADAEAIFQRVLVIDHSETSCRALVRSFQALGADVEPARDENAARQAWARQPFDLAMVEAVQEGQGCLQLAIALKTAAPGRKVFAIAATASVALAVRAMRCGLDGFLPKPCVASQVLLALSDGDNKLLAARHPTLNEIIWEALSQTLESAGSLAEAARRLGLAPRSLRRMLPKYAPKV